MRLYDFIPEMTTKTGVPMKPVLSGQLNGREFCDARFSIKGIQETARRKGLKYTTVHVLAKNLRGKLDLHKRPYASVAYVLVECDYEHPAAHPPTYETRMCPVKAYRDSKGRPTCAADMLTGRMCLLLRTTRMGMVNVCALQTGQKTLESRGETGTLIPCAECIVWPNHEENHEITQA